MLNRAFPVIFLALMVAMASCSTQEVTPPADSPIHVLKSPNDAREYRYLELPNRLRVLLASDPSVDKAAASLVALRGQNHDPEEFGGLAHFLEHMLFIGTEKYPEVDAYQQFIAANGGSSNAYTAADHTNYFFDIHPDYFPEALDRFAHFFINPLLDEAYVDREKNAVHSEYQMQIKDDGWRGYSAMKAVMRSEHPGSRFHIGSLDTLGDGVQEALHEFLETHYSADQMILVAISNADLDTLEAWVTPIFSAIQDRDIGAAKPMPTAFREESLPLVLTYQSLKDTPVVVYNFPVPPTEPHYLEKPGIYITNLLGHEGEGSLHQHLKSAGLIESLGAGESRLDDQNAFIYVEMVLTEAGAAAIEKVTGALFAYINLLRNSPIDEWRYQEQARMAELGFRFQEPSTPSGFAYRVGPLLAHYPPGHVLAAPFLMERFDPDLIRSYLARLTPTNLFMEVVGPNVETDQLEPWFLVPYRSNAFDTSFATPEIPELSLPAPNTFVPQSLDLLATDDQGPAKVVDSPTISLWLDQDTQFGAPRANLYLTLGVEGGLSDPDDYVMAQIYQRLVSDARNELTYPAYLAGLSFRLNASSRGFELHVGGYDDKQPALLADVLNGFTSLALDPAKFALYRSELIREWGNFSRERPYTQTLSSVGHLLVEGRWPPQRLADALREKTLDDLERWRDERLRALTARGLLHGNAGAPDAQAIAELLTENLALGAFPLHQPSVTNVSEPLTLELDIDHADASIALLVQDPDSSFATRARSALAVQLLRQAYFTSLRTEQQLGYVVALSNRSLQHRAGLTFIVQSPAASTAVLQQATEAFMKAQIQAVQAMSEEAFEQNKAGLIARLTERDKNLNQRSARYWSDLHLGVESFDSARQIAQHASKLDKDTVLKFIRDAERRLQTERLLVFNRGRFEEAPSGGRTISDIDAFKSPPG